MAKLTVNINGRDYQLNCDDGQEEHLSGLAAYVDARVAELVQGLGQVGEARLLLLAGLVISDELADAMAELENWRNNGNAGARRADDALAVSLDSLSGRIESIAERLERA